MKLTEITSSMLAEAMGIYLDVAYRENGPPERVLDMARVDRSAPLAAALGREGVEKTEVPDHPGLIDRYRWRLGNDLFPHMKLVIARCSDADDFVFICDTHDRHLPLGSSACQSVEFRELLQHNSAIKRNVEARWHLVGIPTLAGHITSHLHRLRPAPEGKRKTVLIVDNDLAILDLERELVQDAGYEVVTASSGFQALGQLDHLEKVDLCLLDVMMPTLDGFEVARMMREHRMPRFPIIFVSAVPPTRLPPGLAEGYIGKPFDPDHLLDVIREHIG